MGRRRLPNGRFCSSSKAIRKTRKPSTSHRCQWSLILPYLNLADLESFAQSDPSRRSIVWSYLKQGNPLVIDTNTLWRFPPSSENKLYGIYGQQVKHVLFKSLLRRELVYLLKRFDLIEELTLMNVNIGQVYTWRDLSRCRKLSVINSEFEEFPTFIGHIGMLQSLHLKNNKIHLPLEIPTLKSLKMINQDFFRSVIKLPLLEELTVGFPWLRTLSMLASSDFADEPVSVKYFGHPRHLRILNSVDWKLKEHVESLGFESTDMFFSEIPEEEDLILKLNDDCLYHLQTFLPAEDIVSFQKAHSRFAGLRTPTIFNYPSKLSLASNCDYYARIGAWVTILRVNTRMSRDGNTLLRHFKNLKELEWTYEDAENFVENIPNGLKKLIIKDESRGSSTWDMTELCRRLNPTLKELWFISNRYKPNVQGLSELQNITQFRSQGLAVTEEIIGFLNQNQDHMRLLDIKMSGSIEEQNTWQSKLFTTVFQMQSLRSLRMVGYIKTRLCGDLGSLPMLENLELFHCEEDWERSRENLIKILSSLDGSRLNTIYLSSGLAVFDHTISKKLQNLQKLKFDYFGNRPHGLQVIAWMPNLSELDIEYHDLDLGTIQRLRDYLMESNRKFKYNGVEMV